MTRIGKTSPSFSDSRYVNPWPETRVSGSLRHESEPRAVATGVSRQHRAELVVPMYFADTTQTCKQTDRVFNRKSKIKIVTGIYYSLFPHVRSTRSFYASAYGERV